MTMQNIVIAAMLVAGVVMLITGFRLDKSSSFEDGSFLMGDDPAKIRGLADYIERF